MPALYLDHGAYSAQGSIGTNPTTFGVPQEGDGSATTASTAAPVASIDFAGITADATDTLLIAGVTLTCVASGASANQFNAGTGATLATNVAASINAATSTVSTSVARNFSPVNNANQLRNMVYARVVSSTIVEIMFRIGSAQLDHANNTAVVISQSGMSANPTIVQFAGGVGGCFGTFSNGTAIGVGSSIALATYGVFSYAPHVCANGAGVSNYALTIFDPVECRNNGKTLSISMIGSQTQGRVTSPSSLWLRVDDGTIWTEDSPTAAFTYRVNADSSSTYGLLILSAVGHQLIVEARRPDGLVIAVGGGGTGSSVVNFATGASGGAYSTLLKNVKFLEDHSNTTTQYWNLWGTLASGATAAAICNGTTFDNCTFKQATQRAAASVNRGFSVGNGSTTGKHSINFINCTWDENYTGAGDPSVGLVHCVSSAFGTISINIEGGKVLKNGNELTGSAAWPLVTGTVWPDGFHLSVNGLYGVKLPTAIAQMQTVPASNVNAWSDSKSMTISLPDLTRTTRHENQAGVSDWLPSQGYPYLNSTLPDGTGMSLRVLWMSTANLLSVGRGYQSPKIPKQYRSATAAKIVRLNFWCKDAIVFDDLNFRAIFTYVDSAGATRSAVVRGSAVASSAASWSNTGSYSGPTYTAHKVEFDSDTVQLLQGTEVTVSIMLNGAPSTVVNENLFLDPELEFAAT